MQAVPTAFYNEIEPYAAEWLVNLVAAGHIAPGRVDTRSIAELTPGDVRDATQAHFFAGLGGWSHALRLAGWPDDVPVWTGSCPCQPFSAAGKRKGFDDDRHLWPVWFGLIRECAPAVVFGEQVASADGLEWLDAVSANLEGAGYAFAAADLCAAGVGAPHIRQRLYFAAVAVDGRLRVAAALRESASRGGSMGDAGGPRLEGRPGESANDGAQRAPSERAERGGFWSDAEWLTGADGKTRATEPGSFPVVDGLSARMGLIRAYGNAIVPACAATFIRSVKEYLCE